MAEFLDLNGVAYVWEKVKQLFQYAGPSQDGIVSDADQVFGGQKGLYRPIIYGTSDNPAIWFRTSSTSGDVARVLAILDSGGAFLTNMRFIQYSNNGTSRISNYEQYNLPTVDANLSTNPSYDILTTKNHCVELFSGTFNSSSSSQILTDAMDYSMLVLLGRPGDSLNASVTAIVSNLTTSAVKYQIAGQSNYFCVTLKKESSTSNNVIMAYDSTSDTSAGRIVRVYGIT